MSDTWSNDPAVAIGKIVADRCSKFKKNGNPTAPERYAIIFQAATMGAHEAMKFALGKEPE